MTEEQKSRIATFAQQRCCASEYEYVSPEELYSEYVKFDSHCADKFEFTGEMIRLGWILYRPDRLDPMVDTGWRLRLRSHLNPDLPEPAGLIQDQLETLRLATFKSALEAKKMGRHAQAIAYTKAYLEILKARREEFPPDLGNKEGADYADPE